MAYFFDICIKNTDIISKLNTYNYYIYYDSNITITFYFEDNEIRELYKFANEIIRNNYKIDSFYTELGHLLYCTKNYEKNIKIKNLKKIILKNIFNESEDIKK